MTKTPVSPIPRPPTERLLDAAERLLIDEGYAAVTTRRVAEEAGVNHGLIHYYFGSMEELFIQVLERFTATLIERQRDMYARTGPFIDRWRSAMHYLEADLEAGYPKIWLELQALAWNRPELRVRVASVNARWRHVLTEAFQQALEAYGLADSFPVDAVVSLVMTFNQGIMLERLSGVTAGQAELLAFIDTTLTSFESRKVPAG